MKDKVLLIDIFAGLTANNEAVVEQVKAIKREVDSYELISSPGLALNLAKGDWVKNMPASSPAKITKRGGRVCIHIYFNGDQRFSDEEIVNIDVGLMKISASMDGLNLHGGSFSIPAIVGFTAIETYFNQLEKDMHGVWYYANIYQGDGITPLNWWLDYGVDDVPLRNAIWSSELH